MILYNFMRGYSGAANNLYLNTSWVECSTEGRQENSFCHYRRQTTTSNLVGNDILHSLVTMALLHQSSQRSYLEFCLSIEGET